ELDVHALFQNIGTQATKRYFLPRLGRVAYFSRYKVGLSYHYCFGITHRLKRRNPTKIVKIFQEVVGFPCVNPTYESGNGF
ncbi:hypothetical protein, partial [Microcystis aeruginosa]|uniref:hypothetical protein n=1 Tax=Microcystis aeruginosa TaxID=1126 RepID=UPI001B8D2CE7